MKIQATRKSLTAIMVIHIEAEKLFHVEDDQGEVLERHLNNMLTETVEAVEKKCGLHISITDMEIEGDFT